MSSSGALMLIPRFKKNFQAGGTSAPAHTDFSCSLLLVTAQTACCIRVKLPQVQIPPLLLLFLLVSSFSFLILLLLLLHLPRFTNSKLSSKMASHRAGNVNHVISKRLSLRPAAQSCSSPTRGEEEAEEDGGKVWDQERGKVKVGQKRQGEEKCMREGEGGK
ncbi:hypothetical protein Q8A73_015613 [Channa argus]|nr:hypothetical protein Q8A73_015613 [Channa argus]